MRTLPCYSMSVVSWGFLSLLVFKSERSRFTQNLSANLVYARRIVVRLNSRDLTLCGLLLTLIIVGAYIKIPIPYLPFTLQFLFITLAGQLLGWKMGGMVVCVYVAMGLIGFPVFTYGGGISYIFQPTFGYIIAFIFAAMASGFITEKFKFKCRRYIANFAGIFCMYFCGVIYLYFLYLLYFGQDLGILYVLEIGVVLQLPGDIILSLVSAGLAPRLQKHLKH